MNFGMKRAASLDLINSEDYLEKALHTSILRNSKNMLDNNKSISLTDLRKKHTSLATVELFNYNQKKLINKYNQYLQEVLTSNSSISESGDISVESTMWRHRRKSATDARKEPLPDCCTKAKEQKSAKSNNHFDNKTNDSLESNSSGSSISIGAPTVKVIPDSPFERTPSGNYKVDSDKIVFKSSTIGVVMTNPQKVNVALEITDDKSHPKLFKIKSNKCECNRSNSDLSTLAILKEHENYIASYGYTIAEPLDVTWLQQNLPEKLNLMQEVYRRILNHINTDTIIKIETEEFHCHRIVLEVYSTFFQTDRSTVIELPIEKVSPETFETIYHWMTFPVEEYINTITMFNILDVYVAAQFLAIGNLEQHCLFLLTNEHVFKEDYAFILYKQAIAMKLPSIVDIMVPRIQKFFLPLVASKDFLELKLEELLPLLKSNYICVTSEAEIVMSGIRWLHADWQARQQYSAEVMGCMRFGLVSPWQLVDFRRNTENPEVLAVFQESDIKQMIDDGLAYVIVKYWYGKNPETYHHWVHLLGLTEPVERNWTGEDTNYESYKDYLVSLKKYLVPKSNLDDLMTDLQTIRRSIEESASSNLEDNLSTLPVPEDLFYDPNIVLKGSTTNETYNKNEIKAKTCKMVNEALKSENDSSTAAETTPQQSRRHSVAAAYLAAATASLPSSKIPNRRSMDSKFEPRRYSSRPYKSGSPVAVAGANGSPRNSIFDDCKAEEAKATINKLSSSILGPPNKNYMAEESLFNWERETILVFGGLDPHTLYGQGKNWGKDILGYNPISNNWDVVGELPEPRTHHGVAFVRGRVFLVGGADPRDDDVRGKAMVVSTVWSFEPVTRSWYSETGLLTPRKNFGLVVHKKHLYVIGGVDKKGRVLSSVECYDPKTGIWREVAPMSVARMAAAAAKYREYVWVAGGMTGEKKKPLTAAVECYSSKNDQWTKIQDLRFPRCFATLFCMNDQLFLIGGAGKKSNLEKSASSIGSVDVWDWEGKEWKSFVDMSIPRHGHAIAYIGTQVVIIGGVTTIYMRALNNVESYCCARHTWVRGVAALPGPLSGHGAVTLPPAALINYN